MNKQENQKPKGQDIKHMALFPLKAGCLTIVVAGVALLLGLWLDSRLGTLPRWTLILVIGSAPFTLLGVYMIVRKGLQGMQTEGKSDDSDSQEEKSKPW